MYSIWSEFFCWVTYLKHIIQKKNKWYRYLDFKEFFALIVQFYGKKLLVHCMDCLLVSVYLSALHSNAELWAW